MTTQTGRLRLASSRKAMLTRVKGAGHPDTIRAGLELAAAHLAVAAEAARAAGLDDLDVLAVVKTGELPRAAVAS